MWKKRVYINFNVEGLGENLNKRQLFFTVVKDYVEKNNPSFEDLQKAFPDEVQGAKGVVAKEAEKKTLNDITLKNHLRSKMALMWWCATNGVRILMILLK